MTADAARSAGLLGKLLRKFRAGEARSPLSAPGFAGLAAIEVTSPAFTDGGTIPQKHAGKGVGENVSPALAWTGVPSDARHLVLILDDVDVPLPRPLLHTVAVIEPSVKGLAEGGLTPGAPGLRLLRAFGNTYLGPRPIPGHGPHHYRFILLALDVRVPDDIVAANSLLDAISGHVIGRGVLTGSYER